MAEQRFKCKGCGAELAWSPELGRLECPYCGQVPDVEVAGPAGAGPEPEAAPAPEARPPAQPGPIVEHDLSQAAGLARKGWGVARRSLKCGMCGAINDIEPEVTVTECPFCGSAQVRPEEEGPAILRPESLLPFAVGRDKAVSMFRQWLAGLWFRPSSLKKRAEMERIDGVYVPAWTFDCRTSSSWSADAGYHYTTTESYTAMQNGRPVTRTRTVVHTRWVPASGTHQGAYDDWLVQASKGLDQKALKELEPFDTVRGLVPYEERFLAGFKAERYSVNLDDAWRTARAEIAADVERACARMVPGDTHRNLHVSTAVSSVTFKHVLLPVWMASYQYKGKPYRYLVNGETGKATGTAPYSTFKLVAFAILVIAALFALARLTGNV